MTTHSPLVHLELHTTNAAAARSLLTALLGWQVETLRAGSAQYAALDVGPNISSGLAECGTPRSAWLPYVEVADVAAMTARAVELGARVLLAPREGPTGWRSVVAGADIGELALWRPKQTSGQGVR